MPYAKMSEQDTGSRAEVPERRHRAPEHLLYERQVQVREPRTAAGGVAAQCEVRVLLEHAAAAAHEHHRQS